MRVLVITRAPWRNDNNTGNTMTNFFSDMKDMEFYNLYFRDQLPKNDIAIKSFAISEGQLVKNLTKGTPVGREINEQDTTMSNGEDNIYKSAKRVGTSFLVLLRDALWSVGRWKSNNLKKFLDEIKPDVVFMPVFNCYYPHKILQFVKKYTNAGVILFHADDNYTLKQFALSPVYWFYRIKLRKWVRKSVRISDVNYAISNIQKEEYEKAFKREIKILTKGLDFSGVPECKNEYNQPLQFVFTGNIGVNRWKSLGIIASTLKKINANGVKAQMKIYTATPLTDKMKKALNIEGSSRIMGYVDSSKIADIQSNADILIHVEAMDLRNKLLVRQSFSTKIVDYLKAARPILAVGPKDVASIDYFVKNDCAIVADNENELYEKLLSVIENRKALDLLAEKAYECGKKNHDVSMINKMLRNDMIEVIKR
jgi:hypothetical protein